MKKSAILLFVTVALLLFGCKKEKTITGNEPPPDPTVENITVENYVNNCFLQLFGRLPTAAEFSAGFAELRAHNVSPADRQLFLKKLMAEPEYRARHFALESLALCGGQADNQGYIDYLRDEFTTKLANPDLAIQHNALQRNLDRINLLDGAKELWLDGSIDVTELQSRLSDNMIFIYENGVSNNWIEAATVKFFLRDPTDGEKEQFNYANSTLETIYLGQPVASFDDLKKVFFNSGEYFEGQVRWLYRAYLYRDPTAAELQKLVPDWIAKRDYQAMQRAILASNDFLGI